MPHDETWQPYDWEAFVEGCTSCVIYCHGCCPDGLGSARLACLAFAELGLSRLEIVELAHTDRASKVSELIGPDTAVLYVDISPYAEDLPLLRLARRAAVVDHHASVCERMAELRAEMPSLVDLSRTEGDHCASSLIGMEMGAWLMGVPDIERKIALLRKKDVWHYSIPSEWAADANAFVACTQLMPMSLALIDEFLSDLPAVLAKGGEAIDVLRQNALELFKEVEIVAEAGDPDNNLVVLGVELAEELPYDTRFFAKQCQQYSRALILRAHLFAAPSKVDIRLSCTGDAADLGRLARELHEREPEVYIGGGGHPFAAGLQVARAHYDLVRVAEDLLHVAGAVLPDNALTRQRSTTDRPLGTDQARVKMAVVKTRSKTCPFSAMRCLANCEHGA